jgi:DNA-directed RNA polymerase subunit RPC12/RpoP
MRMAKHITACPKCGSTTFYVHEWYVCDGETYDGGLHAHRPSSEIETVACTNCGAEYDASQFEEINFN